MKELDLRHLACPGPVLEVKRALGEGVRTLRVLVADELSASNVTRFATSQGAHAKSEPGASGFVVLMEAGEGVAEAAAALPDDSVECEIPDDAPRRGPVVVQIPGETMGEGDEELGRLLLRSFLKTLAELEGRPDAILFYNTGVRLCCEGSALLEDLARLESEGAEIIACGTCLNYYELGPKLAIGRVTDMLEIATRLSGAGRLIRP